MAFPVGSDVEALCNTCGDVWHIIISKAGERIEKVECKQCGKRHRFRASGDAPQANLKPLRKAAASSGSAAKTGKTASRSRAKPSPAPVVYDPTKPTRPYSIRETYAEGEQIEHKTFGPGVVVAVEAHKIRVSFADAVVKALVCGRA